MAPSGLPARASLEYLKKLAKDRLRAMRAGDPAARLSDAHLAVAREHGFPSWRALKAEVDRRTAGAADAFLAACEAGDVEGVRALLDGDPALADLRRRGTTALHAAVPHPEVLGLLLERGADPDVRDESDRALPLHVAAGGGPLASVRLLLDAGSDPVGAGDEHGLEVIGWATVSDEARRDVVDLLLERGARHHVFSAIALGSPELVRRVVEDDPRALERRLSRHEQEQTALHYVVAPPDGLVGGRFRTGAHHATLRVLVELGADLEARDAEGRTPLAVAMLHGDGEAMHILHDAGATPPPPPAADDEAPSPETLARSMGPITPMLPVRDMEASVAWYRTLGFALQASHGEGGSLDWARLTFGEAAVMLVPDDGAGRRPPPGLSLWIRTDRIDAIHARVTASRMARARAELAGEDDPGPDLAVTADLHTAFYGQREFGVRDPDGVEVMFAQPVA